MILPISHLILVCWLGFSMWESQDPDKYMAWILIFLLDFPVSLLLILLQYLPDISLLGIPKVELVNYWLPFFYFGLVGTVWWYYFPILVCGAFKKDGD